MKQHTQFVYDYLLNIQNSMYTGDASFESSKIYRQFHSLSGIFIPCNFDVCQFYKLGNVLHVSIIERLPFKKFKGDIIINIIDADDLNFEKIFPTMENAIKYYLRMPSILEYNWLISEFK